VQAMQFESAAGLLVIEPQWLQSPECDPQHVAFQLACAAELQAKLADLVDKTKAVNLEVIIAVGHTDITGSAALNQRLSVQRAESVKKFLVGKGVEANRVYTEGKGAANPVADNKTAEGRAKNRRVEVEVVGTRTRRP
ncbi:MAG: OmpA family protein, partial [Betaproteobacteria bacterium]